MIMIVSIFVIVPWEVSSRGDLLIVFLEGSDILTSLGELAFFHTFAHIPYQMYWI